MTYTIFDFDKTLVKGHSFASHNRNNYPAGDTKEVQEAIYNAGKAYAATEKKIDVEKIFKHDGANISAIATYHNNPAFIAGVVSVLLGKELKYSETRRHPRDPIAIDTYTIEGCEPFRICYIPAVGDAFAAAKKELEKKGKNAQITFLRETLGISAASVVDFYDDDSGNVDAVGKLPNTNGFLVSGSKPAFEIVRPHRALPDDSDEEDLGDEWDFGTAVKSVKALGMGGGGAAFFKSPRCAAGSGSGVASSPVKARTPGRIG